MALPDILLCRLIETTRNHDLGGRIVMLGRQRFVGSRRGPSAKLFQAALRTHIPGVEEDDLKNKDDVYSETFFEKLGYDAVDSMDISDFEGASIVQDLSGELSEDLNERFDVVYDGGTCEHVFDLPQAYRNIHKMLKPGGVLIAHSPCNGWINHGFFQICPEVVYGHWEKAMGYEVLELTLQPVRPALASAVTTTSNPNETGMRPKIIGKKPAGTALILNYAVRKPIGPTSSTGTYQSDYQNKWT